MASYDAFAAVLADPEPSLLDGALCLAAIGGRLPDRAAVDDALDAITRSVARSTLDAVIEALCDGAGFTGDRERYDDPRNSLIDLVVLRRRGIPITLSIVAIEVGRRRGVPLTPVGMPGHFLVGSSDDPEHFGDPFHGAVIDRAGCASIVRRLSGGGRALQPGDLEPTPASAVFARMLNNIAAGPWGRDLGRLRELVDLHLLIPDLPAAEQLALAHRLETLGRFDEAAARLEFLSGAAATPGVARDQLSARATAQRARYN